jgi:fumarate reductase flavoprotein subunit
MTHETPHDLVIAGAGTAGMACAITAAERGAKVLVVEKSDRVGGTLHLSAGHLSAGGTRRQQARHIADSPDQHYADVMRVCRHTADPKLLRLAVDEAPHTLDWLEDLGLDFEPTTPKVVFGHVPYLVPRTCWGVDGGLSVLKAMLPQWDRYMASGHIELRLGHALHQLLVENGRVVGLTALARGQAVPFFGQNTVLTTGGYAASPSFFAQAHPDRPRLLSTAAPTSTGDGIIAAQALGAAFRGADKHISSLGGIEAEPGSGRVDYWQLWGLFFSAKYRPPRELYVNALGQRFMNEDELDPDTRERAVAQQPGECFWAIFDEASIDAGPCLVRDWSGEQLRAAALAQKFAWRANSLAELAQLTGLPTGALETTVADYNRAVAQGTDPAFGRHTLAGPVAVPPFYALLSYTCTLISFGGLQVDEHLRVLDVRGVPIAGLYAAGEVLGAAATSGNAFCGGMLITPALSFGRVLGRRLVGWLLPK